MSRTMVSWPVLSPSQTAFIPALTPSLSRRPHGTHRARDPATLGGARGGQRRARVHRRPRAVTPRQCVLSSSSSFFLMQYLTFVRTRTGMCSGRIDQRPRQVLVDPPDYHARRRLRLADLLPQALLRGQARGLKHCPSWNLCRSPLNPPSVRLFGRTC